MHTQIDEKINQWMDELATQRDELRVQAHLLKAETLDEWHALEAKWQHLEANAERVGKSAGESAENVGAAVEQLGEELRASYKKLKQAIR